MRGAKIVGIVVASGAALLVVALLLAWLLFDPNAYKDELQRAFQQATGRELRLDGRLSLSIFPWLAVETGAAAVSNRDGFDPEPFAALDRARLGVRLWPLVSARRLEFGPVRVDGLALNLAVARDGRNNWSDLLERLEEKTARSAPPGDAEPAAESSIARLDIRDARLRFTDAQAGRHYAIEQWDLATGVLRKDQPVDLETSLHVARNGQALGRLEVRTRVDLGQPDRLILDDTEGTLHLARPGTDDLPVALRTPRIAVASATRNIDVQDLEARVGEAVIAATLRIEQGRAGPQARGRLRLAETNPRKLLQALGRPAPVTRDSKVLARLAATSDLAYAPGKGVALDGLELQVDDTRLAGQLTLADFEHRAVRFDLRGNGIDLDRYLPPRATAAPATRVPKGPDEPSPSTGLRALDVRGSIALGRLVVAGIALRDVAANLRLAQGRLAVDPLRARAFGGSAVTRLQYDAAAGVPTLRIEQQLTGVDVAAMLGQLIEVRQLQGRGNASFSLTTRGAGAEALFANLAGPFDLTVTNGALIGTDLWYEIERAVAAAQLRPAAVTSKGSGRTEFERLAARGTIADRTLRNERVEFVSDFARVRGRGKVDYGRDALDLDLTARLLKAPPGRFLGVKVSRIKDADIPLRVTGTMTRPQVRPDVSKLLEAAAKDAIKQPLEGRIKEELEKIFKF